MLHLEFFGPDVYPQSSTLHGGMTGDRTISSLASPISRHLARVTQFPSLYT